MRECARRLHTRDAVDDLVSGVHPRVFTGGWRESFGDGQRRVRSSHFQGNSFYIPHTRWPLALVLPLQSNGSGLSLLFCGRFARALPHVKGVVGLSTRCKVAREPNRVHANGSRAVGRLRPRPDWFDAGENVLQAIRSCDGKVSRGPYDENDMFSASKKSE